MTGERTFKQRRSFGEFDFVFNEFIGFLYCCLMPPNSYRPVFPKLFLTASFWTTKKVYIKNPFHIKVKPK